MEDSVRWSAMYTKHVKQKRKVYHDCFLQLQSSRNKVMLYDEDDQLLESRFLKKGDIIKSGESLVFDSYLVDIGEQCGNCKDNSNLDCQANEIKIKVEEESGSTTSSKSQNRRSTFGKTKAPMIKKCLSPSRKMIRDYKRSEVVKYNSSANCLDTTEPTKTEWQVLYTTQLTQKAKKFHDGILQLVVRGSQRQVMLCDATRTQLDRRFLKKDEMVGSGETLKFDGHLVEIGEQETTRDSEAGSILVEKKLELVGKSVTANNKVYVSNKFSARRVTFKTPPLKSINTSDSSISVERVKSSSKTHAADEPRRAVNEILSTLRKPIQKELIARNNSSVEDSHSSDFVPSNIKAEIKDCAKEVDVNPVVKLHGKSSSKSSQTLDSTEQRPIEFDIISKSEDEDPEKTFSCDSRNNCGGHKEADNRGAAEDINNDCREQYGEDKALEKESPTRTGEYEFPSFDLGF